ncbi:MAG: gliding motility-associated C-terminal domain-containing protein, partial [Bacteroidia bacterium]
MSNATVGACRGTLYDSGNGTTLGHYGHTENYTFTICVQDSAEIFFEFNSFCTELDFDVLRIFDGPDTLSPQIGLPYSGTQTPPPVVSSGNCLTIHFVSDANISCTGWQARWTSTQSDPPESTPIQFSQSQASCGTNTVQVQFATPVACDSIHPGAFFITGPRSNIVTSATPLNCQNDSTNSVQLQLSPGFTWSGDYVVEFHKRYLDDCDSLWTLVTLDTIQVPNCPIGVDLSVDQDTICLGQCVNLNAMAFSGDRQNYHYEWNVSAIDSARIRICPTQDTMITVKVTDESNSTPAYDTIYVYVNQPPQTGPDEILCQTADTIHLQASPIGGWWSGVGITDPGEGIFDPMDAGAGIFTITYHALNNCQAQMQVEVKPIFAGPAAAACLAVDTFHLKGAEPAGGIWYGPFVRDFNAVFEPDSNGSFTIFYEKDGCVAEKKVFIGDINIEQDKDTVCESTVPYNLLFFPPGGVWYGNGIIDSMQGVFSPGLARSGDQTLYYKVNGCIDSIKVFVQALSIGGNLILCPQNEPIWLGTANPPGGYWSGMGVIDSLGGIYDPSFATADFNDVVTYTRGECYASRNVLIRVTNVDIDTIWLCGTDDPIQLDWDRTRRTPYNGLWDGAGVTVQNFPGTFDPKIAGPGDHMLTYTANGCVDTLTIRIRPNTILTDTTVCELSDPITIRTSAPGGYWSGPGLVDDRLGIFDPQIMGIGVHYVYYQTPQACVDSMPIRIEPLGTASLLDFGTDFCYQDTLIVLQAIPSGGVFSGLGVVDSIFNPAWAGAGSHRVEYTLGTGGCAVTDFQAVSIGEPIVLEDTILIDTLCFGNYLLLEAQNSGGSGLFRQYLWTPSNSRSDTLVVHPAQSTTYYVEVSDGCSDPSIGERQVVVKDSMEVSFSVSAPQCSGESGFAIATVFPPGFYAYEWNVNPVQLSDTLYAPTHYDYRVNITDLVNGCETEAKTEIPNSPLVRANFLPNPNEECVSTANAVVEFLDVSRGGINGIWYFGDGDSTAYIPGVNPKHIYAEAGQYRVMLFIENEAACPDSFSKVVCIVPEKPQLHIPNAFSPNGDQVNDVFAVRGVGILQYQLRIYNRWGKVVFESQDPTAVWDGTWQGHPAPEGVYAYFIDGWYRSDNPLIEYGPTLLKERGS